MESISILLFLQGVALPAPHAELVSSAVRVADAALEPRVAAVVWSDPQRAAAASFVAQYRGSVLTVPADAPEERIRDTFLAARYLQLVIFVDSTSPFQRFLAIIGTHLIHPLRVILVLLADATSTQLELKNIMRTAWLHNVSDIVVVSIDSSGSKIQLSTYMPYGKGICGSCDPVTLNNLTKDFFPKKFRNFYGCPIRVRIINFKLYFNYKAENNIIISLNGKDGRVADIIAKKLNMSLTVIHTDKNYTDALVSRQAELILPSLLMNEERYTSTQVIFMGKLPCACFGPRQKEVYTWAKILLPFATEMTIYIAISFGVFVLVTKFVRRFSLSKPTRRRSIVFQAYEIFLGQEVPFETKCYIVNSLFVLWIWICLLIRILYQGILVNTLQQNILEPKLGTFSEAVKIIPNYGGQDYFRENTVGIKFKDRYLVLSLEQQIPYLREIGNGKRFLIFTNTRVVSWVLSNDTFQVLDESMIAFNTGLHVQPAWAAYSELRRIIGVVKQAGLDNKGYEDQKFKILNALPKPLNMNVLKSCFYGLIFMYIVCVTILGVEIAYERFQAKFV